MGKGGVKIPFGVSRIRIGIDGCEAFFLPFNRVTRSLGPEGEPMIEEQASAWLCHIGQHAQLGHLFWEGSFFETKFIFLRS